MLYFGIWFGGALVFFGFLHSVDPDRFDGRISNITIAFLWPITFPPLLLLSIGSALGKVLK